MQIKDKMKLWHIEYIIIKFNMHFIILRNGIESNKLINN